MRRRSRKTARRDRELRKLADQYLEDNPWCEIRWDANCEGRADQVDHRINRSVRPDLVLEPSNFQGCCWYCHHMKTTRVEEALVRGFAQRSWDA